MFSYLCKQPKKGLDLDFAAIEKIITITTVYKFNTS